MIYVVDTEARTITAIGLLSSRDLRRLEADVKKRGAGWELKIAASLPHAVGDHQVFNAPVYPDPDREPAGFRYRRRSV